MPDIENEVKLFEEKYPAIDVTVENVGQGLPHYQKLRSAIEAGEGAPDVAQIEYQYIPSFVLPESLLDLTPYGADDLSGDYVDWAWNQVSPATRCGRSRRTSARWATSTARTSWRRRASPSRRRRTTSTRPPPRP